MKTKTLGLAVLLLAGTASAALAQERGRHDNGDGWSRTPHVAPQSPQAAQPPQAQQPAPAQAAPAPPQGPAARRQGDWNAGARPNRGDDGGRPGWRGPAGEPPRAVEADRQVDPGARPGWNGRDRDGGDWRDRSGRPEPRPDVRRDDDRRPDGRRPDDGGREDRRPDWRGDDHRGDGHRGEDRRRDDRRGEWRGDRGHDHDGPRWERGRFPPVYDSRSRYRGPYWRPPSGFYVRAWRYGEILPRGWYEPEYRIFDWWEYDLPAPPYGYEWVRVGRDVMLVDVDSGRIAQVVRLVFW